MSQPAKRRAKRGISQKRKARRDRRVAEAVVDCYNESEQITGLYTMIDTHLAVPFKTMVLGVAVGRACRPEPAGRNRRCLSTRPHPTDRPDSGPTIAVAAARRRRVDRRLPPLVEWRVAFFTASRFVQP